MYVIGIDFGGTKIEGSVVNSKGKISLTKRIPTPSCNKGKEQIIKGIISVINYLKKESNKKIKGIGISLPGFVDGYGKIVFGGGTLTCLVRTNLKKEIEKKVRLPVYIENDANCFALAEATYGAGRKQKVVVGVIWGTGIGGGLVVDKQIYSGAFGGASEFGHMVIDPEVKKGPKCGCGQRACLEMLSSGKNISRLYKQRGGKIKNANPRQIYDSKEAVSKKIINDAIHYLGIGLATLVNVFNPDVIVLGGGVSNLPLPVYTRIKKEVKRYALPILTKSLKIRKHSISDSSGILGAAALVIND